MVNLMSYPPAVLLLLVCLFSVLAPSLAVAKPPYRSQVESYVDVPVSGPHKTVRVNLDAKWKVWNLIGDPVEVAHVRWNMREGTMLPLPPGYNGTLSLSSVPAEIARKISLYDVELAFRGVRHSQNYYFIIDAGVPAAAGDKWSFNVPGAPGFEELYYKTEVWGREFYQLWDREDFEPLDAARARQLFAEGLNHNLPQRRRMLVLSAKLDLSPVWTWWERNNSPKYAALYETAIENHISNLEDILGLETRPIRDRFAEARKQLESGFGMSTALKQYRSIVDKLNEGVPPRFGVDAQVNRGFLFKEKSSIDSIYQERRQKIAGTLKLGLESARQAAGHDSTAEPWREAKMRELEGREGFAAGVCNPVKYAGKPEDIRVVKEDGKTALLTPDGEYIICPEHEYIYYADNVLMIVGDRDSGTGEFAGTNCLFQTIHRESGRVLLQVRETHSGRGCGRTKSHVFVTNYLDSCGGSFITGELKEGVVGGWKPDIRLVISMDGQQRELGYYEAPYKMVDARGGYEHTRRCIDWVLINRTSSSSREPLVETR